MRASQCFIVLALAASATSAAVLDVPFVRQKRQGCGPASVAMLMQYWSNHGAALDSSELNPGALYQALYDPSVNGASGTSLAGYLRDHSFLAFIVNGAWSDLEVSVGRGRPVIVCLRPGSNQPLHFVVVVGIDESGATVHDPARNPLVHVSKAAFEREWSRTGSWTLIAVPKQLQ